MTWANQIRILKQSFQQLGAIIGKVIINVFKPFIKALNVVLSDVISFAQSIANALGAIFGWTIETSGGGTLNEDIGSVGDTMDDLSGATEDAGKSMDDANKSAKKYQATLLGFDQINKLNSQDLGGTSGGGTGTNPGGSGGGTTIPGSVNAGVVKAGGALTEKFKSSIKDLEGLGKYIRDSLIKAMESIKWEKIYEKARNFGTGLAKFLNGLFSNDKNGNNIFKSLGKTLAGALNTVLYAVFSFSKEFKWMDFGKALASGINEFLEKFDFTTAGLTVGNLVKGLADAVYGLVSDKKMWKNLGKSIAKGINGFIKSMGQRNELGKTGWQMLIIDLNELVDGIMSGFREAFKDVDWVQLGEDLKEALGELKIETVAMVIGGFVLKSLLKKGLVGSAVLGLGKMLWKALKTGIKSLVLKGGVTATIAEDGTIAVSGLGITLGNLLPKIGAAAKMIDPAFWPVILDPLVQQFDNWWNSHDWGRSVNDTLDGIMRLFLPGMDEYYRELGNTSGQWGGKLQRDAKGLIQKLWDNFKEIIGYTAKANGSIKKFGDTLRGVIDDATGVSGFKKIGQTINQTTSDIGTNISNVFGEVTRTIFKSSQDMDSATSGSMESMSENTGNFVESLKNVATQALESNASVGTSFGELSGVVGQSMTSMNAGLQTGIGNVGTSISGAMERMLGSVKDSVGCADKEVKNKTQSILSSFTSNFGAAGILATQKSLLISSSFKISMNNSLNSVKKGMTSSSSEVKNKMIAMANDISSKLTTSDTVTKERLGSISSTIGQEMEDSSSSVQGAMSTISDEINNKLDDASSNTSSSLEDIGKAFSDVFDEAEDTVIDAIMSMRDAMNFSWSLPDLKLPHITINGRFSLNPPMTPTFGIQWYKSGGLFNGATIAGIGEAGSEAVLPLTNKSTMSKIADAITQSGGFGISENMMERAVANGVAMALSMNSGAFNNTPEYINNTIMIGAEEIARAVTKGQRANQARFSPSPSYI